MAELVRSRRRVAIKARKYAGNKVREAGFFCDVCGSQEAAIDLYWFDDGTRRGWMCSPCHSAKDMDGSPNRSPASKSLPFTLLEAIGYDEQYDDFHSEPEQHRQPNVVRERVDDTVFEIRDEDSIAKFGEKVKADQRRG